MADWDYLYRDSLKKCIVRYKPMAKNYPALLQLIELFEENIEVHCLHKLNRWLGYIQASLIHYGQTTVEAERDWTRPLFKPLDSLSDLERQNRRKNKRLMLLIAEKFLSYATEADSEYEYEITYRQKKQG